MKNKVAYEVVFKLIEDSSAARDILRYIITSFDLPATSLVEKEGVKSFAMTVYFDDKDDATRMVETFRTLDLRNIDISLLAHHEKDWATKWKQGWKPFSLTKRFHVIPLWQKDRRCPKGKQAIFLDTTNAFGTGLHETTKFTAQIIESMTGKFDSFLDIGTGSGILSIVAHKLGAKKVYAIDIDPAAVDVARTNLKANRLPVKGVVTSDIAAGAGRRFYDLVAANLVTQDLIEFKDKIIPCVAVGGHLVVSGISLANLALFEREFNHFSLRVIKVVKGKEWAALLFQKTEGQSSDQRL
ncbi:MAG: 50S ribosomal protein L11 methyltransferase [Candidatus Omnitrophica bacterium]|nr:50S ribosomal protein L11 methyltransferase [Candidatus Omnitrophota bacterium]